MTTRPILRQSEKPRKDELITTIRVLEALNVGTVDSPLTLALDKVRAVLRDVLERELQALSPEDVLRKQAVAAFKALHTTIEMILRNSELRRDPAIVLLHLWKFAEEYPEFIAKGQEAEEMRTGFARVAPYQPPDKSWSVDLMSCGGSYPFLILYRERGAEERQII